MAPRLAAPSQRDLHERGAVRARRRAVRPARRARPRRRSRRACSTAITASSSAPARGSSRRRRRGSATILERLATLGTQFGQNVLADEKAYTLVLDGEDDLAGLPGLPRAPRRRAPATERGLAGQARRHAVALLDRAVPALLGRGATCARRRSAPGSARGENGGETDNRRSSPRSWRCAPSGRGCSAIASFAAYKLDRHDGEDAGGGARAADGRSGRRRGRAPRRERDALQELIARGGRQRRARAVGLALLRREAAQARARPRRGRAQAVPPARRDRRGGLRHRRAAVRPRASPSSQDAPLYHPDVRVWEVHARRPAHRPLPRRLFRPALEAQRRLDERRSAARRSSPARSGRSSSTS